MSLHLPYILSSVSILFPHHVLKVCL
uniref:Uncharacterized protein n=1 Tax=Arundo donax TaxID=35708 RepID=A0A0A9CEX4_ARUDO